MNGADALLATLRANGVDTVFSNPGTSEMHFVAALDDVKDIRGVLCLFEGVATGAADGYARVTGTPAATLLHLGPGLGNGWANLHNARRARVPLINIVGDHATYHAPLDAALQSRMELLAEALEGWHRRTARADDVANDTADAIRASFGPPGQIATLMLPADVSWSPLSATMLAPPVVSRPDQDEPSPHVLERALRSLRTKRTALFLGGSAVSKEQLSLAHRISNATGCKVIMETFPTIVDRGQGVASAERLIYLSEFAQAQLKEVETLILLGAVEPVSFFAYPNLPSTLISDECDVVALAPPGTSTLSALGLLVEELEAPQATIEGGERPTKPYGELTTLSFAQAIGATLPEGVIVSDESNTSGVHLLSHTQFAPEHQWMTLTGGAIGQGLPLALGAAMASKRRVLALESDGSMMYTPQALWTMAREGVDVTVVGLSNRSYAVLNMERQRVGAAENGSTSQRMLELDGPELDLSAIARAQGVDSVRVHTAEELTAALERSYATPAPMFIEAMLPKGLS